MNIGYAEKVTSTTLVGVFVDKYPVLSGNCFSVDTSCGKHCRIVNFCLEDILEVVRCGVYWPIKVGFLSNKVAIVHDNRIPDNWYSVRYCETCCPNALLPEPQRLRHERQESRGERVVSENGVFINYKKAPVLKGHEGCN